MTESLKVTLLMVLPMKTVPPLSDALGVVAMPLVSSVNADARLGAKRHVVNIQTGLFILFSY